MLVRDASTLSTPRVWAVVLLSLVVACERDPEPVPIRRVVRPPTAAAGGKPNALQTQKVSVFGGAGESAAGAAGASNAPTAGEFAASLGKIKPFKVAPKKSVKVPYIDALFDEMSQYDLTKHRFKAKKSQYYQVCASLGSFGPDFTLDLHVNGARTTGLAHSRNGVAHGCQTVYLKAKDLLEVWAQQSTNAAVEFPDNDFWDWLSIYPTDACTSLSSIAEFTAPPSTFTKVPYRTERYDIDDQFDAKSNRFTAATTGEYRLCAALTAPVVDFELDLFINDNRENAMAVSSQGNASGCRTVRLTQGQHVEVWAHHSNPAPLKFTPHASWNWLTIDRVSVAEPPSGVSLDNNTAFTATPGNFVKVPYTNPVYDGQNQYDAKAFQFKAAIPSDYRLCASLASLTKDFELDVYVNGAREKALAYGIHGIAQGCRTLRLNKPGDSLEVWVLPTGGESVAIDTNQFWNWLTVERL